MPSISVNILAFPTFAPMPIIGPMDVLNESCSLLRTLNGGMPVAFFDVELVGLSKEPLRFGDSVILTPHRTIANAERPDLLLVPSAGVDVPESLESLAGFVPWMQRCAEGGTRIVSMCTGAFLLAETGLLDGRSATTHWYFADRFRARYPAVKLYPDRLIVDEGTVITSGAATSFLDVTLYLIELYCGHDAAVFTAKTLLIEMGRNTQLPFTILSAYKTHNDRAVLDVQQFIETRGDEELTIEALAEHAGMSLRHLDRRFRNAIGESPTAYLQRFRIERAKRLLETSSDTVEQIMQRVGYDDPRSFRRLFRSMTDLSPREYRRRFGRPLRGATTRPEP